MEGMTARNNHGDEAGEEEPGAGRTTARRGDPEWLPTVMIESLE
jgi:hypothetical protein